MKIGGPRLAVPIARHFPQFIVDRTFPCRVAGAVKHEHDVAIGQVLLVGLANLGGVALESREGDIEPQLLAQLAHGNAGLAVLLVADEVDAPRALSSGRLLAVGAVAFPLLRFRLLDLPQGGVDRGSQLLDISRNQVRAEQGLSVVRQRLDDCPLDRVLRSRSLAAARSAA